MTLCSIGCSWFTAMGSAGLGLCRRLICVVVLVAMRGFMYMAGRRNSGNRTVTGGNSWSKVDGMRERAIGVCLADDRGIHVLCTCENQPPWHCMWCCQDLTPEEIAALSDDEREIIRANLPLPEETIEMMEAHRQLMAAYAANLAFAQAHDFYSLAQPSPLLYVPSVASNESAPMIEGA